jgi:hypothetical protein
MIRNATFNPAPIGGILEKLATYTTRFPRHTVIALILTVALLAFEVFNFDTTRYALTNLLGGASFAGIAWASILALAFCSIDFAGLVRLFTPDDDGEQPREVWYLMGAWLLGATMNALMTWWAVSLTLLNHDFGNEVLSRGELLQYVPIFVAVLVWLTRILFIGAVTVAGSHLLEFGFSDEVEQAAPGKPRTLSLPTGQPLRERRASGTDSGMYEPANISQSPYPSVSDDVPDFLARKRQQRSNGADVESYEEQRIVNRPAPEPAIRQVEEEPVERSQRPTGFSNGTPGRNGSSERKPNGRVRQRPPRPGMSGNSKRSMSASSSRRN